jgi:hypothetical protein
MIYVGIDDTDMIDTPGTNKIARALAADLRDRYDCRLIVRHQLLNDPRVPYTSKNSSAALLFEPRTDDPLDYLIGRVRTFLQSQFVEGSDPGLCVTRSVPAEVTKHGHRCQEELVPQDDARRLAERFGIHLEGLGGTEDGVIGALAAVGLAAEGNDGRVVQIGNWPDDLAGPQDMATLTARGVEVRCLKTGDPLKIERVDVGKHLRPNYREKRIVLFARPVAVSESKCDDWEAVRLL